MAVRTKERDRARTSDMRLTKTDTQWKMCTLWTFGSYLFWAHDNMYEFLHLFVLFRICYCCCCRRRCSCFVPCDLLMRCKVTVLSQLFSLRYTFGTICEQCHSHYVHLNSWIWNNSFHFFSCLFFPQSPLLLLLLLFSIFPLCFAYYFSTSFYVTFDTSTGMGYCIL